MDVTSAPDEKTGYRLIVCRMEILSLFPLPIGVEAIHRSSFGVVVKNVYRNG